MNFIEVDDALAQKLKGTEGRVALCDSQGHIVGYYEPVGPQPMSPELLQWAKEQISDEELDRRAREPGGITTEELLKRLDKL
jgi:hypothetical protein